MSSAAQVDLEVFNSGGQSGVEEVYVQHYKRPVGEIDQVGTGVEYHSVCKQVSTEVERYDPSVHDIEHLIVPSIWKPLHSVACSCIA